MKKIFYYIENYNVERYFISLLKKKKELGIKIRLWWRDDDVYEITDEHITLDANHELAGKVLIFELTLVDINP